ncbi:putative entry exclusion protein TrbK-alt [Nitrobacter sp.]|uniref:putative entry exclusion protein TrbK-alt n=1 Tax=Nitrobacter sp. TaxID=29420 RepID=UPI0029CAAC53|nr:putative entry exclusion protein TrbK-alt [Nitrobacter sp.]
MSRSAKIAGVAALAGMMMAVVIVGARTHDRQTLQAPAAMPASVAPDPLARELDRCATLTMPDSGCEAAWAESRRRFFGEDRPVGPGAKTGNARP